MAGNPTEWVTVSDFTPGIHGDVHGAGGLTNPSDTTRGSILRDGAATIEHTYGCRADTSGALVPLPKRTQGQQQNLVPGNNNKDTTAYYPAGVIGAYLLDAHVVSPINTSTGITSAVMTLWGFQYDTTGGGATFKEMFLGRMFKLPAGTTLDFFWESSDPTTISAAATLSAGGLIPTQGTVLAGYPIPPANIANTVAVAVAWGSGGVAHAAAGIVAAELGLTTYDADVSANYPTGAGGSGDGTFTVPDLAGATNSIKYLNAVNSNLGYTLPVDHQGRLCSVTDNSPDVFGSVPVYDSLLGYGIPLDPNVIAGGGTKGAMQVNRGALRRIGCMASLTADELFIVGMQGGAMLVRGDMANPTIVQLPYVESTFGLAMYPAISPIGVVYGSRNGIFVWSGGDTSKKLSRQIDGFFWNHMGSVETKDYIATRGRFAYWNPYVCVPNNYIYDTDTDAWWRLCAPSTNASIPYNIYCVDGRTGVMYAFPYKLTGNNTAAGKNNTVYDTYDPAVLGASYSWRSQPLVQSRDRNFTIQQVELVATNPTTTTSTVTVTLEGIDDAGALTSRTVTFSLTGSGTSGGRPQIIRQSLPSPDSGQTQGSITARYIQFRIEASNSTVAPKIMSIGMGLTDRSSVAVT